MLAEYLEWNATAHYKYVSNQVRLVAKYGQDDVVRNVLARMDLKRLSSVTLRDAAGNGHLSTSKLLFVHGLTLERCHRTGQGDVFARAVARGGNVDIYYSLNDRGLWNHGHEILLLPIAAERGDRDFAKLVVKNGCNSHPKNEHWKLIKKDLDRRTLLRAVVSGHQDIVRWLVEEIGMHVGGILSWFILNFLRQTSRSMRQMIWELLLSMDPAVQRESWEEGRDNGQKATIAALHECQRALVMRHEDFRQDWYRRTRYDM